MGDEGIESKYDFDHLYPADAVIVPPSVVNLYYSAWFTMELEV